MVRNWTITVLGGKSFLSAVPCGNHVIAYRRMTSDLNKDKVLKELWGCSVHCSFGEYFHGVRVITSRRWADLLQTSTINHLLGCNIPHLVMPVFQAEMSFLSLLSFLSLHPLIINHKSSLAFFLSYLSELLHYLTIKPFLECAWPVLCSGFPFPSPSMPPFLTVGCKAAFSNGWMKSMTQTTWYDFRDTEN